ncbi:MBL fold metallo-hydrolase [Niallia nealsonii]|uniref:Zn-dependent hydrolase n=1 Tax=Niallia nealsonii TaxID=115979 RepID=A0A2N0Z550_9BACI|nr:MBL fold metallo-hydrolase [Niallia nealsonii]PKG24633.1 Zn-dependent hydrolase [Niallia nealsonii]
MQTIEKIGERFWYMTPESETDRPILGMVVGEHKTLMIDAGNSEEHAHSFLEELSTRHVAKPDIVVVTHWHWDHIFGLSALKELVSISSKQTKEEMQKLLPLKWSDEELDKRVKEGTEIDFCANAIKKEYHLHRNIKIVLPQLTFENKIEIDLGGEICVLQHVGGDHAFDSVVIFIKEEKILFLGDSIYADIYSAKRSHTSKEVLRLLDLLETFEANTYILSHWRPISKEEFQAEATLLRSIANYTESFFGDGIKIRNAYKKQVKRELVEDELEVIEYFINGYHDC